MQKLKVSHEIELPLGIVTCEGEVDLYTLPPLKETVHRVVEGGCSHLIFDLAKVR